ncbi:hypothetical protein RCC89_16255 [Cytophagaceae bacterium ABcell3]|nr:hypothetical protein RCC89_16255 [Cytophagaceae bacterium ABcell3]
MNKDSNKRPEDDKLWNKGLSTGEAEEAGDFVGEGKIKKENKKGKHKTEREPIKKPVGNPESINKNEPEGTPGTLPYQPEYENIPTGTTGSNKQRVPGVDKWGPGEE